MQMHVRAISIGPMWTVRGKGSDMLSVILLGGIGERGGKYTRL